MKPSPLAVHFSPQFDFWCPIYIYLYCLSFDIECTFSFCFLFFMLKICVADAQSQSILNLYSYSYTWILYLSIFSACSSMSHSFRWKNFILSCRSGLLELHSVSSVSVWECLCLPFISKS
jgi:hypothetical protein